ncbi:hypothetical protein [Desulfobaculum bizertense]|uniref:Uncharacterized protein n=1 Tax=Desulfobaculum bizertense DSM 18034 TaxID=1121442 RepID=A0A1T4W2E6_9BACT|nr:hypothetical protein [Desulfobaculum bizertense]UIJ38867.1 hypothetical protein LWC08_04640 [Desulfobaculum bizertense]SKA71319.1 hypothetical protein SAMN02745702_01454 [Desulfobaculum bizertense DSM 18034]
MIDIESLRLALTVSTTVTAFAVLWLHRSRFAVRGTREWATSYALLLAGLVFRALRSEIPTGVSSVFSYTATFGGYVWLLLGVRRFLGEQKAGGGWTREGMASLAAAFLVFGGVFELLGEGRMSQLVPACAYIVLSLYTGYVLLRSQKDALVQEALGRAFLVNGCMIAACELEQFWGFTQPLAPELMQYASEIFVFWQLLFSLLVAFALMLMVGEHLHQQLILQRSKEQKKSP